MVGYTTPTIGRWSIASDDYDEQFNGDYEYVVGSGHLDECNNMQINGHYGYFVPEAYPCVDFGMSYQHAGPFFQLGAASEGSARRGS